jgi:hypothetical protein
MLGYRFCILAAALFIAGAGKSAMAESNNTAALRQPPRLVPISVDTLPKAKPLGTPEVNTLLGYTRRPLHLQDGYRMGLFSFSNSTEANWLFLVDARDMSFERFAIPNNDIGTHGAALGADGNIYIMPYRTARAYRFNVLRQSFESLEVDLPEGEYTWEALGASNGRIYFGTYPNAYFGEYVIATGACYLWKQVAPNTKYVTSFSEDTDGRIHFKAWGPEQVWMVFDPESRDITVAEAPGGSSKASKHGPLPSPPEGDEKLRNVITVGERQFSMGFPSSRLWEIAPDGLRLCGNPKSAAEPTWWLKATGDSLVGVSYYGALFRYDLKSGAFERGHLSNRSPGGNSIMFIESVSPRCVIGANYSQQNLFKVDPETGRIESSVEMIARTTGEPMCAVGFGGKGYLGIYINSILSVYDPQAPFSFGTNPRELIELGEKYAQTRPKAAVTDGHLVYISSDSAYNHLGGALAVIDPETEKVDVYHHLIRDQDLPTLAYDPMTKLVWGGTNRWGQMRSHPPTQESSLLYAFDGQTRDVVARLTPWPGADVTDVMGISANGILVARSGEEIALIQTTTREILYQGTSPIGIPSRIRRGADGNSYCLAGGVLYRWDFTENLLTAVAKAPRCQRLTQPSPGLWVLADGTTLYRVRPEPSPHADAEQ